MNPAKSVHAAPQRTNRLMQDISQPPVAAQPAGILKAKVVDKIPVKSPAGGPMGGVPNEDAELDKIMRDVGRELKNADKKPAKHHWFSKKSQASPRVPASPAPPEPEPPVPAPTKPVATSAAQPVIQPAKQTQTRRSAPGMAIFLAILVTGALIAAAIYIYK